eukprot:27444_1
MFSFVERINRINRRRYTSATSTTHRKVHSTHCTNTTIYTQPDCPHVRYVAVPPTQKSVNIGNNKFCCTSSSNIDTSNGVALVFRFYCNQNQRHNCVAKFRTILFSNKAYPSWAIY